MLFKDAIVKYCFRSLILTCTNSIFSAQSNNEQHNRTNTTIAALSAAADSSSDKPSSYQRLNSDLDHEGMQIEFRNLEAESDHSNIPGHTIGDVEFCHSSNREACNNLSSRSG